MTIYHFSAIFVSSVLFFFALFSLSLAVGDEMTSRQLIFLLPRGAGKPISGQESSDFVDSISHKPNLVIVTYVVHLITHKEHFNSFEFYIGFTHQLVHGYISLQFTWPFPSYLLSLAKTLFWGTLPAYKRTHAYIYNTYKRRR